MELTPTFPIGSVLDCGHDVDANFLAASRLSKREIVPTEINFDTVLVPMAESVLKDTPHRGYGAAYLDVFLEDCLTGPEQHFAGVTDFERCALVYAKAGAIKTKGQSIRTHAGKVLALHQVHLYYEEVHPSTTLSDADLRERLRFAQNTGFVLIGPDECLAVLTKHEGNDYTFCDVYENNSQGVVRNLAGYYAESLDARLGTMRISELDASATDRALTKVGGDLYWWARPGMPVNDEQVRRMQEAYRLLDEHRPNAPLERKASGASVKRWFIENGSTASVQDLVKRAAGWVRYSTWQDDWFFGLWVNPTSLECLTYAEQDVMHVKCENADQFNQELADLAQRYGQSRSPSMMAIGPDGTAICFDTLTFLKGKVETLQFTHPAPKAEGRRQYNVPLFGSLKMDHPMVLGIQNGDRIELSAEAFELDLLNPVAFEGPHRADLSKTEGSLQVTLYMADGREYASDPLSQGKGERNAPV
ncbi:hypothetical protein [Polaromonas sp. JS666]|uniref:hypothetical protein n=1 Tax=Polaromonas sp. (strain JS666 / ATCC BAA-500) TaxID=296591 RepID=UPI000673F537|nr:hypothetical protein [Polaromonas sp. JS666]